MPCARRLLPDAHELGSAEASKATDRRYNSVVITLAENEEHLVEALRALPADVSDHVVRWVTRLRDIANGRNIDWSPEWTEEDIADARNASIAAFDQPESRHT
jgi:hypothetical protein